jgi:hypothetical protein
LNFSQSSEWPLIGGRRALGNRLRFPSNRHSRKQGSEHHQYLGVRRQKRTNHRRPKHQRKHNPHKKSVNVHCTARPVPSPQGSTSASAMFDASTGTFGTEATQSRHSLYTQRLHQRGEGPVHDCGLRERHVYDSASQKSPATKAGRSSERYSPEPSWVWVSGKRSATTEIPTRLASLWYRMGPPSHH